MAKQTADSKIISDAARCNDLRTNCNCDRCRVKIDGNTSYSQTKWFRGIQFAAYYCDPCARLLKVMGDDDFEILADPIHPADY